MLTINPLIAKRREFTGSLARLPKLRAGERLFVKRTNPVPIDAEETLRDLFYSVEARLTDLPKKDASRSQCQARG